MTSKNLTNLHLPRLDKLKVNKTLNFISTSKIYFGETGLMWLGILVARMMTSVGSMAAFAFVTKDFVTAALADAIASVGTLSPHQCDYLRGYNPAHKITNVVT